MYLHCLSISNGGIKMIRAFSNSVEEVDRIMSIWRKATIKAHNFISEAYWDKNYSIVKDQYIPISETYVYLDDKDEIQGFISIIEGNFIGAVFVDVDCQGTGIGSKLINHVKDKYGVLELAVYKDNEKSVHFYKKVGFEVLKEELNEETNKSEFIMRYKRA